MIADGEASAPVFDAVLFQENGDALRDMAWHQAQETTAIIPVFGCHAQAGVSAHDDYPLDWLLIERSISVNTAAAGGNASLMSIG